jgi:V8-like Glu-specific endopeptidase
MNDQKAYILKIITRYDGTRPSFLVKYGIPDIAGTVDPEWNSYLSPCPPALERAIGCTGCITYSDSLVGTGFLIAQNLIVTNRHVLQTVAKFKNGSWLIYKDVGIDFGYEYEGRQKHLPRKVVKVIYAGSAEIHPDAIDHTKADIALLEIDGDTDTNSQQPIAFRLTQSLIAGTKIFTIGYPHQAPEGESSEAASIFAGKYCVKRIAPGEVISGSVPSYPGRICHDASTLSGNSGSLVVVCGDEEVAAAIHYGGTTDPVSENWGHSLAYFCGEGINPSLKGYFDTYGVKYV